MFTYRRANKADLKTAADIAILLHTDDIYEDIYEEIAESLEKESEGIWLCYDDDKSIAFAHSSLRYDYVEGTSGGSIGYLEGIYVLPEYRKKGIARELVIICENWAREKGCAEFASDCEFDNIDSYKFHLKIGFGEVNRIICFAKKL